MLVKTGSVLIGSGFSSVGPFFPKKMEWADTGVVFMSEIRKKSFLPQVCNKHFVFYVFCFSCSFCQLLILSSTSPVFTNRKKNMPSFNRSAYVESKLRKPQQQCFVAPFLHAISRIIFSLSTILLVESSAFVVILLICLSALQSYQAFSALH